MPQCALASRQILLQTKWKKKIVSGSGRRRIVNNNPKTAYSCCVGIPHEWRTINNSIISNVKNCVSLKALGENTAKKQNLKCCSRAGEIMGATEQQAVQGAFKKRRDPSI